MEAIPSSGVTPGRSNTIPSSPCRWVVAILRSNSWVEFLLCSLRSPESGNSSPAEALTSVSVPEETVEHRRKGSLHTRAAFGPSTTFTFLIFSARGLCAGPESSSISVSAPVEGTSVSVSTVRAATLALLRRSSLSSRIHCTRSFRRMGLLSPPAAEKTSL